jgi:hypothetical protein
MTVDYTVASLPELSFTAPAPITWERFCELVGGEGEVKRLEERFSDLDVQLRNAMAEARNGEDCKRPAQGCSLFWKNRISACFSEKDVASREKALDRVRWDAAGELTPPASPLGKGALATYAIRLKIALKRSAVSSDDGRAVFDKMMEETKTTF